MREGGLRALAAGRAGGSSNSFPTLPLVFKGRRPSRQLLKFSQFSAFLLREILGRVLWHTTQGRFCPLGFGGRKRQASPYNLSLTSYISGGTTS